MNSDRANLQRALEQLERSVSELQGEGLGELEFWHRYIPLVREALSCSGTFDGRWMRDRIADIEGVRGIINPNHEKGSSR